MTKLTPEAVEKLEHAAKDRPKGFYTDTILTLCREWRERGEALQGVGESARSYETEYDGRMYEVCTSCDAQISQDQSHKPDCVWPVVDAALKGADHDPD